MTEHEELARWLYRLADERTCNRRRGIRPHPSSLARAAALLREARPQPVPVAERLPGPEDCDTEGRVWIIQPWEPDPAGLQWNLLRSKYASTNYSATHWLPHWAIPTPAESTPPSPLPPMINPIPCNCYLDDEPPCPSPCVFDDPSEEINSCAYAAILRGTGRPKTNCKHYRETSAAAELTDNQLLVIAEEAISADDIADAHTEGYPLELTTIDLLSVQRAAIAADRANRPQPTPEALQAAYVEWFKANQGIPPSPTAARTAAAFTLAVLAGEVEV